MSPKPKKSTDLKVNFESTLSKIETLIETLEQDHNSLDVVLSAFEKGIKLTREARKELVRAEQKVQLLLGEGRQPETSEFSDGEFGV